MTFSWFLWGFSKCWQRYFSGVFIKFANLLQLYNSFAHKYENKNIISKKNDWYCQCRNGSNTSNSSHWKDKKMKANSSLCLWNLINIFHRFARNYCFDELDRWFWWLRVKAHLEFNFTPAMCRYAFIIAYEFILQDEIHFITIWIVLTFQNSWLIQMVISLILPPNYAINSPQFDLPF